MNPWVSTRAGNGIVGYLGYVGMESEKSENEVIESIQDILKYMKAYFRMAAAAKEGQDTAKVGEFIDKEGIQQKIQLAGGIAEYLKKINEGTKVLKKKAMEEAPGNQLYVEHEFHNDFFAVNDFSKDRSLVEIARKTNKIHENTYRKLENVLLNNPSVLSKKIVESVRAETEVIRNITAKYASR